MFLGLFLVFRPIAVVADVVPLIGTVFGAGIGVFAGLTAAVLSLVVIALAWLYFRPVLGMARLVLALVLLVALVALGASVAPRARPASPRRAASPGPGGNGRWAGVTGSDRPRAGTGPRS